jgi:hypothetical protein
LSFPFRSLAATAAIAPALARRAMGHDPVPRCGKSSCGAAHCFAGAVAAALRRPSAGAKPAASAA